MQNVPKIVSERLRASATVADRSLADHSLADRSLADHPDADVLTAFSERSLSDRERAVVLDHLARCGDCREVVALALPTSEDVQPVVRPARSAWFTWPALRWGFAAAGLVVIASFGGVEYQRQTRQHSTVAKFAEPRAESRDSRSQAQPAVAAPSSGPISGLAQDESTRKQAAETSAHAIGGVALPSAGERISEPKSSKPILTSHLAPPAFQSNEFHGSASSASRSAMTNNRQIAGGPNMPVQWQQQQRRATSGAGAVASAAAANPQSVPVVNTPLAAQSASAPAPAPQAEMNQVQSAGAQLDQAPTGQTATQTSNQQLAQSDQFSSALVVDGQPDLVSKAKPATMRASATRNAPPHWSISSAGTLQRSFDQGKTWQDVDVMAKLAVPDLNSYASPEAVARAKEKDNAGDKKVSANSISSPVFRAVAVNGRDVWAGGSNAVLCHSLDAGNHWRQIVPSSDGVSLSGDVISLEFSDARQGRVRTSTGETWMTTDDGQTWQKR